MNRIFLWFYCLDIPDVLGLVLLATMGFGLLRHRYGGWKYWKTVAVLLFVCWVAVVLLGTLGNRTSAEEASRPVLIPFYSYYLAAAVGPVERYRVNLMNVILFYPAGLLGCGLLPKRWKAGRRIMLITVLFALVSIGIECCQYYFRLGLVETDDVIHNTLGVLLGAIVYAIPEKHKARKVDR